MVAALAAFLVVASPLGQPAAVAAKSTSCARDAPRIGPFSRPFANSWQVSDIRSAARLLSFRPLVPKRWGRPFRVYVQARSIERRQRMFGLVYRRAPADWVQISESLAGAPQAVYDELIVDLARRDLCGSDARLVRLADGSRALTIRTDDRFVVNFRRGRVGVLLLGPAQAFSRSEALALANELVS